MSRHQTDEAARRRLLDAQRAEARALRAVMTVARRRESLQERVDAVDGELAEAQATLAAISGIARAATLLELEERELRQRVKRAAPPFTAGTSGPRDNTNPISKA